MRKNQFPDPDFWQHPQATRQKKEVTLTPREFLTPRGGAPCEHLKPTATTPERQRAPMEAKGTHGRRLRPKSWNQQRGMSPDRDLRQRRTHFPQDEFYDTAAQRPTLPIGSTLGSQRPRSFYATVTTTVYTQLSSMYEGRCSCKFMSTPKK